MTTLLRRGPEGSAETWRTAEAPPRVPPELTPPTEGSARERLRAWRERHRLRERRAEDYFESSRRPDRALPVADRKAVGRFFADLVRRRRGPVIALLVLHALAAIAGLIVPRILGRLVDQAAAPGTLAATLNGLALAVAGVVVVQAVMTFLALRTSAVFGQEVLAAAREYVVRTVLALPLGRVESASSGDLVTRVTRDVGTMAQTIRFGLPETVIAIMTTGLTVAAMLLNSALLTLPLLVVRPAADRGRAALSQAGAAGLHHRGRDLLGDQLDADRDGRGGADGRGARAAAAGGASSSTSTSTCRRRPSATR